MTEADYPNINGITAEALCPVCTPEPRNITRLTFVKTILNPEPIMIFYCPKCRKEFHELQCIFSNYTWMYIDEEVEYLKEEIINEHKN